MSEGDYLAGDDLSQLGDDELGILAKDVAGLSNRLADSEMSRKQMLSDISVAVLSLCVFVRCSDHRC